MSIRFRKNQTLAALVLLVRKINYNCSYAWGPLMVAAGSQASGLSAPTLLDGAPPAFSSTAKASLPAVAGRQAKKFCLKLDPILKNPDI